MIIRIILMKLPEIDHDLQSLLPSFRLKKTQILTCGGSSDFAENAQSSVNDMSVFLGYLEEEVWETYTDPGHP